MAIEKIPCVELALLKSFTTKQAFEKCLGTLDHLVAKPYNAA